MFQVGALGEFAAADPWFATWEAALAFAYQKTEQYADTPCGIWREAGELIAIVYQGDVFKN